MNSTKFGFSYLFPGKVRVDSHDYLRGGYNLFFPIIVCDLAIPGGPPAPNTPWKLPPRSTRTPAPVFTQTTSATAPNVSTIQSKPALLFFGPPTDKKAAKRLNKEFSEIFSVDFFDDAGEAMENISQNDTVYVACVAKLGSKGNCFGEFSSEFSFFSPMNSVIVFFSNLFFPGNRGIDVIKVLREKESQNPNQKKCYVIVHSATAVGSQATTQHLRNDCGVDYVVDHDSEKQMMEALKKLL